MVVGEHTEQIDVHVPKSRHSFIIGKNGSVREEIQLDTHTTIIVPPPRPEHTENIRVIGRKENLEAAKAKILKISVRTKHKAIKHLRLINSAGRGKGGYCHPRGKETTTSAISCSKTRRQGPSWCGSSDCWARRPSCLGEVSCRSWETRSFDWAKRKENRRYSGTKWS